MVAIGECEAKEGCCNKYYNKCRNSITKGLITKNHFP